MPEVEVSTFVSESGAAVLALDVPKCWSILSASPQRRKRACQRVNPDRVRRERRSTVILCGGHLTHDREGRISHAADTCSISSTDSTISPCRRVSVTSRRKRASITLAWSGDPSNVGLGATSAGLKMKDVSWWLSAPRMPSVPRNQIRIWSASMPRQGLESTRATQSMSTPDSAWNAKSAVFLSPTPRGRMMSVGSDFSYPVRACRTCSGEDCVPLFSPGGVSDEFLQPVARDAFPQHQYRPRFRSAPPWDSSDVNFYDDVHADTHPWSAHGASLTNSGTAAHHPRTDPAHAGVTLAGATAAGTGAEYVDVGTAPAGPSVSTMAPLYSNPASPGGQTTPSMPATGTVTGPDGAMVDTSSASRSASAVHATVTNHVIMLEVDIDHTAYLVRLPGPSGASRIGLQTTSVRHHVVDAVEVSRNPAPNSDARNVSQVAGKPQLLKVSHGFGTQLHAPRDPHVPLHITQHAFALVKVQQTSPTAQTAALPQGAGPPESQSAAQTHHNSITGNGSAMDTHHSMTAMPSSEAALVSGQSNSLGATLAMTSTIQQGAMFGIVSSVAIECLQQYLTKSARGKLCWLDVSVGFGSATVRGATLGGVGAALAVAGGPLLPTAVFMGLGVCRDWHLQALSYLDSSASGSEAVGRGMEAVVGAVGGVVSAWWAASALAGVGGLYVAAGAGCCGFIGGLAARQAGSSFVHWLLDETVQEKNQLRAAYAELGLSPLCTDKEVVKAYKRAALASHPDRRRSQAALVDPDGPSHERFIRIVAAVNLIRDNRKAIGVIKIKPRRRRPEITSANT